MTYVVMIINKIQLAKNYNTWVIKTYNYNSSTLNLRNLNLGLWKKGWDFHPIGPHLIN
jgi:hypothetical protein